MLLFYCKLHQKKCLWKWWYILRLFLIFDEFCSNFETIELHWCSQKFWWGLWRFLMTFFGDIMAMTSLKWRHNWFFKFDFVIISLKKQTLPCHVTSGHQTQRLRSVVGGEPPTFGDFWKFVTKIMHFRHISAKIQLKTWNKFRLAPPLPRQRPWSIVLLFSSGAGYNAHWQIILWLPIRRAGSRPSRTPDWVAPALLGFSFQSSLSNTAWCKLILERSISHNPSFWPGEKNRVNKLLP